MLVLIKQRFKKMQLKAHISIQCMYTHPYQYHNS